MTLAKSELDNAIKECTDALKEAKALRRQGFTRSPQLFKEFERLQHAAFTAKVMVQPDRPASRSGL